MVELGPSSDALPAAVEHVGGEALKRRLLITLLTVLFYFYPSLLATTLSLFQCYHIDGGNSRQTLLYPQNARVCNAYQL